VISGGNYGINSNLGNYHDNADISASGTVTNAGTIIGQQGTAVVFGGTSQNRLVVDPGATFQGIVTASTKASNTLEFADGGGTLTGIGSEYIGFQTIVVDATAQWTAAGTNTFAANTMLTNQGTLAGLTFTGAGTVRNDGVIQGSAAAGLYLVGGGSIVNAASASIIGANQGVRNIGTVGWQITQTGGTITGTSGDGVSNAGSSVGWDITQAYGSGGTGSGSGTISGGMNGVSNSGTNVTWDITQGYRSQGTPTSGSSSAVITGERDRCRTLWRFHQMQIGMTDACPPICSSTSPGPGTGTATSRNSGGFCHPLLSALGSGVFARVYIALMPDCLAFLDLPLGCHPRIAERQPVIRRSAPSVRFGCPGLGRKLSRALEYVD
jgi:hypothetical protein